MAHLHADERSYSANVSAEIWPSAFNSGNDYKAAILDISRGDDKIPTLSLSLTEEEYYDLRDSVISAGKTLGWTAL